MADSKKIDMNTLREAFKEGATPNEKDYSDLIDLARVGGKALGATDRDATTLNIGKGLMLDGGKLAVRGDKGVSVDADGVAVKVDDKTLSVAQGGGLSVKLKSNGGLIADDTAGVHVNAGAGLVTGAGGLAVSLDPKGSLTTEGGKLAVAISAKSAGLMFDAQGALKVKLAPSENYIAQTDGGLAITTEGVEKIKNALETASIKALDNAVKKTESGAKKGNDLEGKVEEKIAAALNTAHGKGYAKKHDENQLQVTQKKITYHVNVDDTAYLVNIKELAGIKKWDGGDLREDEVYFIPGKNDKTIWDNIVGTKGVILEGKLSLNAGLKTPGVFNLKVLAVAVTPNTNNTAGELDIAGAEITLRIIVNPTITNVTVKPTGSSQVEKPLTLSYDFTPSGDDDSTVEWRWKDGNTWKVGARGRGKEWTPQRSFIGRTIKAVVKPGSKILKDEYKHASAEISSNEVSIVNVIPLNHIAVNGHVFAPTAGFPTTGFVGAKFTLVLEGRHNASEFKWETNASSWVRVSDGGEVSFIGKGNGNEVVITGTAKSGGGRVTYKFRLTSWFTNKGSTTMTWSEANAAC